MKKVAYTLMALGLLCGSALMAAPQQQADMLPPPIFPVIVK